MNKLQHLRFCVDGKRISMLICFSILCSCSDYFKNDYEDNSPTSGKLRVYYDEGIAPHIKNQVYTFEALYPRAHVELFEANDDKAVDALFHDSCEAIVISRQLNQNEKNAFESKQFHPSYTAVAQSGVLLITNKQTPVSKISISEIKGLLTKGATLKDSLNNDIRLNVLFDKNNSSVVNYILDSITGRKALSNNCNILNSSLESIRYVAEHANTIAFVDYAWLSDKDDSLFQSQIKKIKFLAVSKNNADTFYYPDQSNFKLGLYPMTRTIYIYKKTGDFTLAKGFESFIAGPKGQLTFLKQGLLPNRQNERAVEVKLH